MSTGAPRPMAGQQPAGWYPDPWMQGRQQRFWNGSGWTQQVAPWAPTQPRHQPSAPPHHQMAAQAAAVTGGDGPRPRRFLTIGLGMFLVVIAAVIYAMVRGQDVDEVSATGVKFKGRGSSEQINEQQAQMESRLIELERKAKSETGNEPVAPQAIDLTGTWSGPGGFSYEIQQFGSEAVIQELSPYGVTATGYGSVSDYGVRFTYQAFDGSTGVADLEIVDDGTLEGTFENHSYGTSTSAVLRR